MDSNKRGSFSKVTKEIIAKKAGYRCSNPSCRRLTTVSHGDLSKDTNIGVAAHICAAAPGGPRYDSAMSIAERSSADNGIWLCPACSALIDKDEKKYSVKILREWKEQAEKADKPKKNLIDYDETQLRTLLACDKPNVSDGVLDRTEKAAISPETIDRTILIGLGGLGVKTVDYIKQRVSKLFDPSWPRYIAFLGIDADYYGLDYATNLSTNEKVLTTRPGVGLRAISPASYPKAWRRFVEPEVSEHLRDLGMAGSARNRLVGKMKIHDQEPGCQGVDESIVEKLLLLKNNILYNIVGNGNYEVYVIGSIGGGTCGGGILEMPSLIHKALGRNNAHIYAMLYLPDTLTGLDPQSKVILEANGYASLKELNYYQGISMREGYKESFSFNCQAEDALTVDYFQGFYTIPYLIGSPTGAAMNSARIAQSTIAEFFIRTLGKMDSKEPSAPLFSQFRNIASNYSAIRDVSIDNPEIEADGTAHEFPKCYAAIGFASAEVPKSFYRAYIIGEACKKAGLKSIPFDERTMMAERGVDLLPFLGPTDYLSPMTGFKKAEQLLEPLLVFMRQYSDESFNITELPDIQPVEWRTIRDNTFDTAHFHQMIDRYIEDHTSDKVLDLLRQNVCKVYNDFRENVHNYVEQNGPYAFCNLFDGKYEDGGANPEAVGILRMITRLHDGRFHNRDTLMNQESIIDARNLLAACKEDIMNVNILDVFGNKKKTEQAWINAFNLWVNTRVNVILREKLLGSDGYLQKEFIDPAITLKKQLFCFGRILDNLSSAYADLGSSLSNYNAFQNACSNVTEVNMAAVNIHVHAGLQSQAQKVIDAVNGKYVRHRMITSFFETPLDWLEFHNELVLEPTPGAISLRNPEMAANARLMFDMCMDETVQVNTISIEDLFHVEKTGKGDYDAYARQILEALQKRSVVLLDGRLDDKDFRRYIVYPSSLKNNNIAITSAIENAAKQIYRNIDFYYSGFADSIMFYQIAMPFEIYRLNQLPSWEQQYEHTSENPWYCMHGRSPDLLVTKSTDGTSSYTELTSWRDYPAITFNRNPKQKDLKSGTISHEGTIRKEIDVIIEKAKKLGVLYSAQDMTGKWFINRVICDKSIEWNFNADLMLADTDGLLPMGKELADAVAAQNEKNLEEISRVVALHQGGLLNLSHTTEEWAWFYAARVLYSHRPMLREIRDTLAKFEQWSEQIQEYNESVLSKWKPVKIYRMVQGRFLYPDKAGRWIMQKADGTQAIITNLSEDNIRAISRWDPQGHALITEGFTLYYVYTKLMESPFSTQEAMDDAVARAEAEIANPATPELIDESITFAINAVEVQTAHAIELGINLENSDRQKPSVLHAMEEKGIRNDTVSEIAVFYYKLKKCNEVFHAMSDLAKAEELNNNTFEQQNSISEKDFNADVPLLRMIISSTISSSSDAPQSYDGFLKRTNTAFQKYVAEETKWSDRSSWGLEEWAFLFSYDKEKQALTAAYEKELQELLYQLYLIDTEQIISNEIDEPTVVEEETQDFYSEAPREQFADHILTKNTSSGSEQVSTLDTSDPFSDDYVPNSADLEEATKLVLQDFEVWLDKECKKNGKQFQIIKHAERQSSGDQYGYDVGMTFSIDGASYMLCFECKDYTSNCSADGKSRNLNARAYAVNLLKFFINCDPEINNRWVLVSPFGKLQNNYPEKLFLAWNRHHVYTKIFSIAETDPSQEAAASLSVSSCPPCSKFLSVNEAAFRLVYGNRKLQLVDKEEVFRAILLEIVGGDYIKKSISNALKKFKFPTDFQQASVLLSEQTSDNCDAFDTVLKTLTEIDSGKELNVAGKDGIYIIGEYGTGKTWLVYRIIREIIRHSGKYPFSPVLMRLKSKEFSWDDTEKGIPELVKDYIELVFEQQNQIEEYSVFSKRPVFFLDGFDETLSGLSSTDKKIQILCELRLQLKTNFPLAKIVVTSRESDYNACYTNSKFIELFEGFVKIELKDCSVQNAKEKVLELSSIPGKKTDALKRLASDDKLMEIARRPVFFTLLTLLAEDGESSLDGVVDQYSLLDRAISREIEKIPGKHRDSLQETLFRCAMDCTRDNTTETTVSFPGKDLYDAVLIGIVSVKNIRAENATIEHPWTFRADLGNTCRIKFLHNIVREFLVAKQFFQLLESICIENSGCNNRETEQKFFSLLCQIRMSVASLHFFMNALDRSPNKIICEKRIKTWLCQSEVKSDTALSGRLLELLLQPGYTLSGEANAPLQLDNIHADNLYIWNCKLQHLDLHGAKLHNMQMIATELSGIDLRAADLTGLRLAPAKPISDFINWREGNNWNVSVLYEDGQLLQYSFTDRFVQDPYSIRIVSNTKTDRGVFLQNKQLFLHSDKSLHLLDASSEKTKELFQLQGEKELKRIRLCSGGNNIVVENNGCNSVISFRKNAIAQYRLSKTAFEHFCFTDTGQFAFVIEKELVLLFQNGNVHQLCEWNSDYECFAVWKLDNGVLDIYIKCKDLLIQISYDAEYHEMGRKMYPIKGDKGTMRSLQVIKEGVFVTASESELYIFTLGDNMVTSKKLNTAVKVSDVQLQNSDGSERLLDQDAYALISASIV